MMPLDEDVLEGLRCGYSLAKAQQMAYEMQYYRAYGRLPDDACVIEYVVEENEAYVWVHRDPDSVN